MPFIERNDIYKAIVAQTSLASYMGMTTYLSTFVCPSSPPDSTTTPVLAYAGNCGSASNVWRFDGVMQDTTIPPGSTNGKVSLDDISAADGTAMTVILSEKCISGSTSFAQGYWDTNLTTGTSFTFSIGTSGTYVPGFGLTTGSATRVINPTGLPAVSGNATVGQITSPSSNHPGGVVVAFADGHTGFLKDSLGPTVYAQLLSWNHAGATRPNVPAGTNPNFSSIYTTTWNAASYPVLSEGDFQ